MYKLYTLQLRNDGTTENSCSYMHKNVGKKYRGKLSLMGIHSKEDDTDKQRSHVCMCS